MTVDSTDETETLRREVAELERALVSRSRIEQAKGMLMLHFGIGEGPAFRILVRWSNQHNVRLATVASTLIHESGGEAVQERETSPDPGLHRSIRDVTGAPGGRQRVHQQNL